MSERTGVITFKGGPLTLVGPELVTGEAAPDFSCLEILDARTLADSEGKVRLLNVVPSLDTPVCAEQTKRFNDELANLGDNVAVITVSADLPFAQARWCGEAGANGITFYSDHRDTDFGQAYGVLIKELRLLTRAIFVVDSSGNLTYQEIVPEVTDFPNYDAAIEAVKSAS